MYVDTYRDRGHGDGGGVNAKGVTSAERGRQVETSLLLLHVNLYIYIYIYIFWHVGHTNKHEFRHLLYLRLVCCIRAERFFSYSLHSCCTTAIQNTRFVSVRCNVYLYIFVWKLLTPSYFADQGGKNHIKSRFDYYFWFSVYTRFVFVWNSFVCKIKRKTKLIFFIRAYLFELYTIDRWCPWFLKWPE